MLSQDVLQLQQVYVGAQRHLPHAVGVEVELVICDLHKMLMRRKGDRGKKPVFKCADVRRMNLETAAC